MLVAEEYVLLTMNDAGRSSVSARDAGVAGALLGELAAGERVMVDARGRMEVVDSGSTGDDILDTVLTRIAEKAGRKPKDVLSHLGRGMTRELLGRLATAEIVQEDRTEVLGVRVFSTWPFVDTTHRDALRAELVRVLRGEQQPDARTGSLVALLEATGAWRTALPGETRQGLSGREIGHAAKEIGKGRWASEAVRKAVEAAAGAATAAMVGANGGSS